MPLRTLPEELRYACLSVTTNLGHHAFVQYVLPPGSVVYSGCVGDDDLAEQLKAANAREGLDQVYYVKKDERTGACAVVITGHDRYGLFPIHSSD